MPHLHALVQQPVKQRAVYKLALNKVYWFAYYYTNNPVYLHDLLELFTILVVICERLISVSISYLLTWAHLVHVGATTAETHSVGSIFWTKLRPL
jgi:hypothetical protein